MADGYTISSKLEDMDINAIHSFISSSYWAKNIPLKTLQRGIKNSLCFGVFEDVSRAQVGFARLITDRATYAYLADVYIHDAHRGKGLSKHLMQAIVEHPDLQGLRRMTLATLDAHNLYAKYGFKPLAKPEIFMEKWVPDIYSDNHK